jgi:NAD(P)-dependent dehydrogenase (short-subunit alcohol dehydrogenase family)
MDASRPVVLVTGGARRIGRAIVEDLAAHGWAVAIHVNTSRDEGERLADAIRQGGGTAAVVTGNLGDVGAVADIVAAANQALGKLTLLVNNASIFEVDGVGNLDAALWQRQMNVNLAAPVFLADAFAAQLPEDAEGNIINIVDQRVWKPIPRYFSYHLSKTGLWTVTQMLAQALAPRIRVNAVAPGPTLRHVDQTEAQFLAHAETTLPLRRPVSLTDYGRTIRYLVETPSVTGQMIGLDSGQHLTWQTPDLAEYE